MSPSLVSKEVLQCVFVVSRIDHCVPISTEAGGCQVSRIHVGPQSEPLEVCHHIFGSLSTFYIEPSISRPWP